jgi:hypothetical protein
MIFGISAPVLIMLTVGVVELISVTADNAKLQNAADAAALAGAEQLRIAQMGVKERVEAMVRANLQEKQLAYVQTNVDLLDDGEVKVTLDGRRPSFFANLLPPGGWRMFATSTAASLNKAPLCVLAHGDSVNKAIELKDTAKIDARTCMVHSNGELTAKGMSWVQAAMVTTVKEATGRITPTPSVGAAPVPDPFLGLNLKHGLCTDLGLDILILAHRTLPAGVHCGIYRVASGGELVLEKGEHYFSGARLEVGESGVVSGDDVVLVLDKGAKIKFKDQARVRLKGRRSGPLAGFVMISARDNTKDLDIWSDNVDELLGVVYAPNAKIQVDGKAEVAEDSEWTVLVAKSIEVKGSASVKLNTDYTSSLVPVPEGVGPGAVRLVQ